MLQLAAKLWTVCERIGKHQLEIQDFGKEFLSTFQTHNLNM